jgi:hypothetical protein
MDDTGRMERWDGELTELFAGYAMTIAPIAAAPIAERFDIVYNVDVAERWLVNNSRIAAESYNDATAAALAEALAAQAGTKTKAAGDEAPTVDDVFDAAAGPRADAAGQDRVTQVTNFARNDAAQQGGATTKTWTVTNRNSRHPELNGETVGLHDTFSNGGLWPRDPGLSAAETAGCQCIVDFTEAALTADDLLADEGPPTWGDALDGEERLQFAIDRYLPDFAREGIEGLPLDQVVADYVKALSGPAQRLLDGDVALYVASDGSILTVDSSVHVTAHELATIKDSVSSLRGGFGSTKPMTVNVVGQAAVDAQAALSKQEAVRGAWGWAAQGGNNVTITPLSFTNEGITSYKAASRAEWIAPASKDASLLQYTVAHEWGHTVATAGGAGGVTAQSILAEAERAGTLISDYATTSTAEAFAESFAEWWLTAGTTANVTVQQLARAEGWPTP